MTIIGPDNPEHPFQQVLRERLGRDATSYAAEVVADSSGEFNGNALRFATAEEAELYVADLKRRWTLVTDTRVVPSDDPVTHEVVDGVLRRRAQRDLVGTLREEARLLASIAESLDENREGEGFAESTFDAAVSDTVRCSSRLLHAVGEHDFNLDDYPPEGGDNG